eukprot:6744333-Prymnesium_polylepis.1
MEAGGATTLIFETSRIKSTVDVVPRPESRSAGSSGRKMRSRQRPRPIWVGRSSDRNPGYQGWRYIAAFFKTRSHSSIL